MAGNRKIWGREPDRTTTNRDSDKRTFYGFDDKKKGTTDWYDKNGNLDSTTRTPKDEDDD